MKVKEEGICITCGQEESASVCQKCQEMEYSCDCTRLTREEYQEWLKGRDN